MSKRRILIVDDQAEIRRLVRWALQDGDFAIYEAANGELALRIAQVVRPDLVVLDQQMPGPLDGLAVCAAFRQDAQLASALLLMLTGHAEASDRQAALDAGVNYFLAKPFAPGRLREIVDLMLRNAPPATLQ